MHLYRQEEQNRHHVDFPHQGNQFSTLGNGLQQHEMHPPFQRYFRQGLANENRHPNFHANPNFQSLQHNPNAGSNFSQPRRVNIRSEYLSNQVHPMIENGWSGDKPMAFNTSNSYYPKSESHNFSTNPPAPIVGNGQSFQQWPGTLEAQSKFNVRFQRLDVNPSQFSPQATIANAPTPYQLHQWANGSLNIFFPTAVNGTNHRQAQGEFDNGLGFNHPHFKGVYVPRSTILLSELRKQMISIAREIKLRTVESISAPSEHAQPQGNEEFFMLYLVILGQYLLQEGSAWYTDLPPPAMSPRATDLLSSSPIPFNLDKIKRESQKSDGINGNPCASKKISPIDTTDWDTVLHSPDFFALGDVDCSAPLDSGGVLIEPDDFEIYSDYCPSPSMNDGGSFSLSPPSEPKNSNTPLSTPSMRFHPLSPCAPVFVPASKGHRTISNVDGDHGPLESPDNIILSKSPPEPGQGRDYSPRIQSVSLADGEMLIDPFVTNNSSNTITPSVASLQRTRPYLLIPPTPISPFHHASSSDLGSPTSRDRSFAHKPLQFPSNICFIRTKPGSGIRICLLPGKIWVDLPQIGIHHCDEDLPDIHYVMGSASWFYTKNWVPILYQEIFTYNSLKRFERLAKAPTQSAPAPSTVPTGYVDLYGRPIFFQAGNSKPEPKVELFPSGDDLGVNWNATPAERRRIRKAEVRQMWENWEEGVRDARLFCHLWKKWGRIKGWTGKQNKCGDNATGEEKNMIAHHQLMMIVLLTSKQGSGIKLIGSEEKKKFLDGRSIGQFKHDWEERIRKFGSSNCLE
ncbi:uncharacterized protein EAF01_001126 [Botrytis porri]|uniref:Uncharacterized protein n=1 Tax=Botrytis porri TaxID=87229 RepID=A0A4Z1KUW3_9HELO|nr:uncharacterized protein EAF01_001126 [Botrytis porri]KAF7912105.1 hypothetical protein EAF01_001126 [Botrytis porri]TGO88233.1 hypothetical protein BPOR_0175g00070 [Botrytis porri]